MPDKITNAPKAGERAKGAKQDPIQNQAEKVLHKSRYKARFGKFLSANAERKISVTGTVGRKLRCWVTADNVGITSTRFGTRALRLANHVYLLMRRHRHSIKANRLKNGKNLSSLYTDLRRCHFRNHLA